MTVSRISRDPRQNSTVEKPLRSLSHYRIVNLIQCKIKRRGHLRGGATLSGEPVRRFGPPPWRLRRAAQPLLGSSSAKWAAVSRLAPSLAAWWPRFCSREAAVLAEKSPQDHGLRPHLAVPEPHLRRCAAADQRDPRPRVAPRRRVALRGRGHLKAALYGVLWRGARVETPPLRPADEELTAS
eukprot:scaffold602_cov298-Pinguiococcus_pyrenoidosus.AAC.45